MFELIYCCVAVFTMIIISYCLSLLEEDKDIYTDIEGKMVRGGCAFLMGMMWPITLSIIILAGITYYLLGLITPKR